MPVDLSETAPVACTLGAGDFQARVALIGDLNGRALLGQRREDLQLELTYAPEARETVLAMVRGEQDCCAFLKFEVDTQPAFIRVVIRAPERAREAADKVFEPFLSAASVNSGCSCRGAT